MLFVQLGMAHEQTYVEEVDADIVFAVATLGIPPQFAQPAAMGQANHFHGAKCLGVALQHSLILVVAELLQMVVVGEFIHQLVILSAPRGMLPQYLLQQFLRQLSKKHFAIHVEHKGRVHTILRLSFYPILQTVHIKMQRYIKKTNN